MKKTFDKYSFILLSLIVVAIQLYCVTTINYPITVSGWLLIGFAVAILIYFNWRYIKLHKQYILLLLTSEVQTLQKQSIIGGTIFQLIPLAMPLFGANRTITISDYVLFGCSIVMLILVNITYLKAYHEVEKRQVA